MERGFYRSKKGKMMIAAAVATSSFAVGAVVEQGNEVEASTKYNWEKYNVTSKEVVIDTITSSQSSLNSSDAINRYKSTGLYGDVFVKMNSIINPPDEFGASQGFSYLYEFIGIKYERGALVGNVVGAIDAYTNNTHNADGFWYIRGSMINTAPTTPSLTVPTIQFEHGDKHIIGMNATDPNGDTITYTLQASYNGGSWENIYTGTAKTYEYTVPNNKQSVKFRVIASDGSLSSTSSESSVKSIREVMYFWSKYNTATQKYYNETDWYHEGNENGGIIFERTHRGYTLDTNTGLFSGTGGTLGVWNYPAGTVGYYSSGTTIWKYTVIFAGSATYRVETKNSWLINNEVRGNLISNSLQDTYNKYNHNEKNADGFWYVRGQRVLSDDVTPPIIELEEQEEYGNTSTVTVKTHDLGTVSKVKWAIGEQDVAYFTSNGTEIGVGQTTPSNFTVSENGIYTVCAVDNKGNKAVQTIDVTKINLPAEIQDITTNKFNIVDDSTTVELSGTYTDRENNDVTVSVESNGQNSGSGTGTGGVFSATVNGANLSNGVHENPFSITLNDGVVDGTSVQTTDHIVIKVDDVASYKADLNGHTNDADSYTKVQHEAFYNAYEAVLKYEGSKLQTDYEAAHIAISEMKQATQINESTTVSEWVERLAVVFADQALKNAEASFSLVDYTDAKDLIGKLSLQSNKEFLSARLTELNKYHIASDLLVPMESEIARHKTEPTSTFDISIVNTATFNEVQAAIAFLQNITPNPTKTYKADLNKRLNDIRAYYLKNKDVLTPDDLEDTVINVNTALGGMYGEFRDMFVPINEESTLYLQEVVDYVNILAEFLKQVDSTTYNNYKNYVSVDLLDTPETTVVTGKIQTITAVVDAVMEYRQTFRNDAGELAELAQVISDMDVKKQADGTSITQTRFNQIQSALKEVTEYTDVPLLDEFSETEKTEAFAAVEQLVEGQFKTDMTSYLLNGVPDIILSDDPYAYIIDGTLIVKGNITDDNEVHTVKVIFDGVNKDFVNISTKTFEAEFNGLAEGAYTGKEFTVTVNDGFVTKGIQITKPVVSVSNPVIFTEMVKKLEVDQNASFANMSETTLTELLAVFNQMIGVDQTTSLTALTDLYVRAGQLSGENEGVLVHYIKEFIHANLLQWIFDNYTIVTPVDFEKVHVAGVNLDNIENLKTLIADYKNNHSPATTPTAQNYVDWVTMLGSLELLDEKIIAAYLIDVADTLATEIGEIATKITNTIPQWSSQGIAFETKLTNLKAYQTALNAVIGAETSFLQSDKDSAALLVSAVIDQDAQTALTNRLTDVQAIIDAIILVETAETTLEQTDIDVAQTAVTDLKDGIKKQELQERLNKIGQYNAALAAVVQAETTFTQADHDAAETLVTSLAEGTQKDDLVNRLTEVQKVIDATKAVEHAETTASVTAINQAQTLIDLLTPGAKQSELQIRLDLVKQYTEAIKAVVQAETTFTQADHDAAETLVTSLAEGTQKDDLVNRLVEVQKVIDATKAVEQAELSKSETDINTAQTLVIALNAGNEKNELQARINELLKYVAAEKAVTTAESTLKQIDKDTAETLVNQLQDGPDKDALLDRLDKLQTVIDKKSAEEKAEDAVEKAENSWEKQDKDAAETLVNQLDDGTAKDDLINRLEELQKLIDLYNAAKAAVEQAESSKLEDDVNTAQALVNQLPTGTKTTELQTRLDEVNHYIAADKAVTKAENSLYQRHLDEAQALVNVLQDGPDKHYLQDRLDQLQLIIGEKVDDILDRIVNGGQPPVTAQELADYVKPEIVYEELLDDYIKELQEIADINGSITKDDVIAVIRLVNALEIAKRQMDNVSISTYQNELAITTVPTKNKYPEPRIMYATASYLVDNAQKQELGEALAELLNRNLSDVLAEMEALLAGVEVTAPGIYTVKYVTEDGTIIFEEVIENVNFGFVDVTASEIQGYTIVGEKTQTIELTEENNEMEIIFNVSEVDVITTGTYTVKYVTEDGQVIHSEEFTDIELGDIEVVATAIEGYEVVGESTQTIELTEENAEMEIVFYVTNSLISEEPKSEEADTEPLEEENENNTDSITGDSEENEVPSDEETEEVNETVPEVIDESEEQAPTEEQTETEEIENIVSETIGEETALVRSLLVASLEDLNFSFTKVAINTAVSHEQYLYQAAQALLMVKAYETNQNQANLDAALNFVAANVLDGAYKKQLMDLLGADINSIGDDGEPDLTPVKPYEPPTVVPTNPVTPPVTPVEPVQPVQPPVVEPSNPEPNPYVPPVIEFEVPPVIEGTPAVEEKVNEVIKHEDGSYTWVIENPLNTDFTLTASDMKIDISFDKKIIEAAKKLEVHWKHLGNEHYKLLIYADGKEVEQFTAEIELSKQRDFAYMLRQVDKTYKAMPYNYTDGKFNFAITRTGVFFFSKDKVTFDDISKFVEMKPAIEELASRHIVHGVKPGQYAPNAKITRAQFAAMLTRALGLEASDNDSPFNDTKGKWFEKEVQALYEAGIISGVSATKFNPNAKLTREQAAAMLNKVIELNGKQTGTLKTAADGSDNSFAKLPTFADAESISAYAKKGVATLESLNIVHGKPDGSFDPKGALTRAQMAKMITGVLKFTGDM